jgi:hypothetical protein
VDLAASLTKVLVKLWPDEVDKIGEEVATTDGPKPCFVSGDDFDSFVELLSASGYVN